MFRFGQLHVSRPDSFFSFSRRFVLGLLNGIMPAVRTMTREICGPEHVVMGMTYVGGEISVRCLIVVSIRMPSAIANSLLHPIRASGEVILSMNTNMSNLRCHRRHPKNVAAVTHLTIAGCTEAKHICVT